LGQIKLATIVFYVYMVLGWLNVCEGVDRARALRQAKEFTKAAELESDVEKKRAAQNLQYTKLLKMPASDIAVHYGVLLAEGEDMPLINKQMVTREICEQNSAEENHRTWAVAFYPRPLAVMDSGKWIMPKTEAWDVAAPSWTAVMVWGDSQEAKHACGLWLESFFNDTFLSHFSSWEAGNAGPFENMLHTLNDLYIEQTQRIKPSAKFSAMVGTVMKTVRGFIRILEPEPDAGGSSPEDAEYIAPLGKIPAECLSSHSNSCARLIYKAIRKSPRIMKLVDGYRKVAGGEATHGKELLALKASTEDICSRMPENGEYEDGLQDLEPRLSVMGTWMEKHKLWCDPSNLREGACVKTSQLVFRITEASFVTLRKQECSGRNLEALEFLYILASAVLHEDEAVTKLQQSVLDLCNYWKTQTAASRLMTSLGSAMASTDELKAFLAAMKEHLRTEKDAAARDAIVEQYWKGWGFVARTVCCEGTKLQQVEAMYDISKLLIEGQPPIIFLATLPEGEGGFKQCAKVLVTLSSAMIAMHTTMAALKDPDIDVYKAGGSSSGLPVVLHIDTLIKVIGRISAISKKPPAETGPAFTWIQHMCTSFEEC
jgi:hypothetical protein